MRVSNFSDTLIYEFTISDFANDEIAERINKIISLEHYKNKTYLTFIEERENELKQVRGFLEDHDQRKLANIQEVQRDIEQLNSEVSKLESEIKLKQQELEQIKSKKIPEKEELFKKHFVPSSDLISYAPVVIKQQQRIITQPPVLNNDRTYKIDSVKDGVKASGKYYDTKKFIVLAGSTVSIELDISFGKGAADGAYELRKDLEKTGIINSNREFIEDYTFTSISQAACVVLGGSRSGPREWK